VLDRIEVWSGRRDYPASQLAGVEAWLIEAATAFRAPVRLDPWQAIGSMQRAPLARRCAARSSP
jgi:hypothetical protein